MKNLLIFLTAISLCVSTASALTDKERKLVRDIQVQVRLASKEYDKALQDSTLAIQQAETADVHAQEVDEDLQVVQKQVDAHQKNEERLSSLVNKYEPFWKQGHAWFGFGAILLGVGLLLKHMFILAIIAIPLGIAISIFAPGAFSVIRAFVGTAMSWIKSIINSLRGK